MSQLQTGKMMTWIGPVAARTAVGLRADATAAAIRAGVSRIREHPFLTDAIGDPLKCGMDSLLDPEQPCDVRIAELAHAAFVELVGKLGPGFPTNAPLLLTLPERRPGFDQDEEAQAVRTIRSFVGGFRLELGPRGHAGSLVALQKAQELLGRGAESVIVLAADSYLDKETLRWLDDDDRLPGSGVAGGFPPGEAAAALVVTSRPPPRQGDVALLRGVGGATEPRGRESDEGTLGEGLTQALRSAAANLRLPDEAVDDLYGDINGERHRSDDWAFTCLRFPQLARRLSDYRLCTDCVGDVGAATGALGCVLAVRAWRRGYATGPRALVWAGSDGGLRGAAVLQKGDA
jgi:3-oxoacyl-[acyl-carrier-protein] synthase I